jgi:hypothetical protein
MILSIFDPFALHHTRVPKPCHSTPRHLAHGRSHLFVTTRKQRAVRIGSRSLASVSGRITNGLLLSGQIAGLTVALLGTESKTLDI